MKLPHRRRLRWPFWTSTMVAVVLLAAAVSSRWIHFLAMRGSVRDYSGVRIAAGAMSYYSGQNPMVPFGPSIGGWGLARPRFFERFKWVPTCDQTPVRGGPRFELVIPLYLLAAPFVLFSTFYYFRAPLKHGAGHCLHCNYDRAGLADDAACPECGKAANP